jgi:hypothetical protein
MPRTMEEKLNGADPEPWIAEEEGESIFGEIEEVGTRDGDYGEYPVITVLCENGDVFTVAGFGTVLKGKLEGLTDADIGRKIGVKFVGEKQSKAGKDYKDWRVVLSAREAVTVPPGEEHDEFPDEDL